MGKQLLDTKKLSKNMRKLFRKRSKKKTIHKPKRNTELEAEHRRLNTRRSVKRFVRKFWDETNVSRKMERILRKRSRKEKAPGVQEKEERVYKRNARLTRFCNHEGYRDLVSILRSHENAGYFGLRHPEIRKDNASLEYYLGFINGKLSEIEDIRIIFRNAKMAVAKKVMEEKLKRQEQKKEGE